MFRNVKELVYSNVKITLALPYSCHYFLNPHLNAAYTYNRETRSHSGSDLSHTSPTNSLSLLVTSWKGLPPVPASCHCQKGKIQNCQPVTRKYQDTHSLEVLPLRRAQNKTNNDNEAGWESSWGTGGNYSTQLESACTVQSCIFTFSSPIRSMFPSAWSKILRRKVTLRLLVSAACYSLRTHTSVQIVSWGAKKTWK